MGVKFLFGGNKEFWKQIVVIIYKIVNLINDAKVYT